jgi:hypothetical protein
LTPSINDEVPHLTVGQEVVWLTTQETLKPTEDDLAWMRNHRKPELWANFKDTLMLHKETRLTVNLDPLLHKKKLFHFDTWMREGGWTATNPDDPSQTFTGSDVLDTIDGLVPSNKKHWWIYLGTIKPIRPRASGCDVLTGLLCVCVDGVSELAFPDNGAETLCRVRSERALFVLAWASRPLD